MTSWLTSLIWVHDLIYEREEGLDVMRRQRQEPKGKPITPLDFPSHRA